MQTNTILNYEVVAILSFYVQIFFWQPVPILSLAMYVFKLLGYLTMGMLNDPFKAKNSP